MDYNNKPDGYYNNVRQEMLAYLPANARKILDVGCGNGAFAATIKTKNSAEVWGIEYMDEEAKQAEQVLDNVFSGPCESFIKDLPDNFFDVIYFNDVLEHLVDPYDVLDQIKHKLAPNGVVISSIPNMRYYNAFIKLLVKKDWQYEGHGIMDKTHLRFFTNKSIKTMYKDAGYTITTHEGINKTKSIRPLLFNIPLLFTQMDMLNLQYATVAKFDR